MFCAKCGGALDSGAMVCSACVTAVGPAATSPALSSSSTPSDIATFSHIVAVYGGHLGRVDFSLEDPSGRVLGVTQGEIAFPLKYTVLDSAQQPVLILDGVRVRGLSYDYLVHEPSGAVLASARQESSFMSREYGVRKGGTPQWTLTTVSLGYHYRLIDNATQGVLASGDRTSGLRRSFVDVTFSDRRHWGHRIGIGLMMLVYYLCTRQTG
jgi:hypothetical protein